MIEYNNDTASVEGRTVDDRFLVGSLLSCGGVANVYLAEDLLTSDSVAFKQPSTLLPNSARRNRLIRYEAEILSEFLHPNIPYFVSSGGDRGRSYLCLEYAEFGSLSDEVRRVGPLPEQYAVSAILQVLDALQAAHDRGIIHRDVKPGNILQTKGGRALLADFGAALSENHSSSSIFSGGGMVGTLSYASPEQLNDASRARPQSDLYSVGLTLYAIMTARNPFGISADHPHLRNISNLLIREVLTVALNRDPEKRFESAVAMAAALKDACPEAASSDTALPFDPQPVQAARAV